MLQVRTRVAPSAIHGLGLFARDAIVKDEAVWMYDGSELVMHPELAREVCRREFLDRYGHWCALTGKVMICLDDARYINHAWEPNLTSWAPNNSFCLSHRAARDIAAGEELTVDYRIGDAEPWRGFEEQYFAYRGFNKEEAQ